jgi:hypothetical protein
MNPLRMPGGSSVLREVPPSGKSRKRDYKSYLHEGGYDSFSVLVEREDYPKEDN